MKKTPKATPFQSNGRPKKEKLYTGDLIYLIRIFSKILHNSCHSDLDKLTSTESVVEPHYYVRVILRTLGSEKSQNRRRFLYTKASPKHTLWHSKTFSAKHADTNYEINSMSNFKVVNKIYKFNTRGEIDFVDLSDKVQKEVADSEIRNGIVHVFSPHATGILVLTENDYALLEDIKVFLEELAPKHKRVSASLKCSFSFAFNASSTR